MTVDIFIHQFIFWNVIVKQATDVWVLNKTIHIDDRYNNRYISQNLQV